MKTLIGVISYNDVVNTVRTVDSLFGHGDIVVWDNNSQDDTVVALRKKFGDRIIIHEHPVNSLWTPACNGVIANYLKGHRYILLSNNDITYRPYSVSRLEAVLDTEPSVGIVGPGGAGLGGLQDFGTHWGQRALKDVTQIPTVRANYVVGAAMMFRSKMIDEIGYLDNDMPLGADDHDYCIRAKEANYQIKVVNSAYVAHKSHATYKHSKHIWDEWGGKSWAVFNEKWAGYYYNEEEAIKCHWGCDYHPGWDKGTGWLTEEARLEIWQFRNAPYEPRNGR